MDENYMISVAQPYYHDLQNVLTEDRLQEINDATSILGPAVKGGEPRGLARTMGLNRLLQSPNVYPVGVGSDEIRACVKVFDTRLANVNNTTQPWVLQRETCIRLYWNVHDHLQEQTLAGSDLASGKHVQSNFDLEKLNAACLAIVKCAYGFHRTATSLATLMKMGEYRENQLVHYMFVMPMVVFFCTEMNPHVSLDPRSILTRKLNRTENNIKTKLRNYGAWSQAEAIRRIGLPDGHPESLTYRDEPLVSGIEYEFFRYYTIILKGMSLPWDQYLRSHNNLWISRAEHQLLFYGYDDHFCFTRYPRPRHRNGAWR